LVFFFSGGPSGARHSLYPADFPIPPMSFSFFLLGHSRIDPFFLSWLVFPDFGPEFESFLCGKFFFSDFVTLFFLLCWQGFRKATPLWLDCFFFTARKSAANFDAGFPPRPSPCFSTVSCYQNRHNVDFFSFNPFFPQAFFPLFTPFLLRMAPYGRVEGKKGNAPQALWSAFEFRTLHK